MILELKSIEKSFGPKKVLSSLDIKAESGKAFGLLGRNGAGKTTTIRILMDVFPADSGSVLIDGAPIDYDKIKFGYLPEERGLYPKKVIFDQLVYFALLKGMSLRAAEKSISYWLTRLGMAEEKKKRLDTLSKGNQQKIQLITAIAHDPDIVVLDEPFSGLDPVNAMLLKSVVRELIEKGKIVLFSSHQMNYIEEFCDSIAILKDGRIAVSGDIAALKRSYVRDRLVVKTQHPEALKRDFAHRICGEERDTVIIRMDRPEDKREFMCRLAESYDIEGVSVYEPSLNDIFVKYAGDSEEEE